MGEKLIQFLRINLVAVILINSYLAKGEKKTMPQYRKF